MDTMDFLVDNRSANAPRPATRRTPASSTVKFVHSNNVILKKGAYKGYFGTVSGYTPAMTRIQYEIPETLELEKINAKIVRSNASFRQNSIVVINEPYLRVAYQNAYLYQIVSMDRDRCSARPLMENGSQINSLESLAQIVKGRLNTNNEMITKYEVMMNEPVQELSIERCRFEFPEFIVMINEKYNGFVGKIKKIERNQIINSKTQKTNIDNQNKIKNGPYKGFTVHILGEESARLRVRVEATSREETHLMDTNYRMNPITPADVFYMDVRLNSGNFFQVNRIRIINNVVTLLGVERVVRTNSNGQTVTDLVDRMITEADIAERMPGFSYSGAGASGTIPSRLSQEVLGDQTESDVMQEYTTDNTENNTTIDDDDDDTGDSFEEPEDAENADGDGKVSKSSSQSSLVSSFSDSQRVETVGPELTEDQKVVRDYLNRMASLYLREDMTNLNLINEIGAAITAAINEFNKAQNWNPSDGKFIAAVLFIRYMIRNGRGDLIGRGRVRVNQYVNRLIEANIFNTNDIIESVFTEAGERRAEGTIHRMFGRAVDFVNRTFGEVLLDQDYSVREADLIPLNNARQREASANASTRFANIWQVMENKIPEHATKIHWPETYEKVFKRTESLLKKEENMRKDKKGKEVYEFVKKNLRQAPIELKRLGKQPDTQANRIQYNALKLTYEKTHRLLKKRYNKILQEKSEKVENLRQQRESAMQRRRTAIETKNITDKIQKYDIQVDDPEYEKFVADLANKFGTQEFVEVMESQDPQDDSQDESHLIPRRND